MRNQASATKQFQKAPKKVPPRSEQLGIANFGFHTFTGPPGVYFLQLPNWFLVLIAATLSVAPWLKLRFSLRTLLIALTLVALLWEWSRLRRRTAAARCDNGAPSREQPARQMMASGAVPGRRLLCTVAEQISWTAGHRSKCRQESDQT